MESKRLWPLGLFGGLLLALSGASFAQAPTLDPASIAQEIETARLEVPKAVTLQRVKLGAGPALLTLEGKLVPASPVGGKVAEMVFLGKGKIELTPPDEVEAGQLELFTGARKVSETFDRAVLVFGLDRAVDALLRRPAATLDPQETQEAQAAYERWKKGPERELVGVPGALWADALGDPAASGLFAARFHSEDLGDFLYLFDPNSREQVTLGRFEPIEASEREKRKIARRIAREQRRGRLIGVELDDLGQFDTWLSMSQKGKAGLAPGAENFEPLLYKLDIDIDDRKASIAGTATITLEPSIPGARTFRLRLNRDYEVQKIESKGVALPTFRAGGEILGLLPETVAAGQTVEVVVQYRGEALQEVDRAIALADTDGWYPHVGDIDRARYEASFRWPKKYKLLAPGHRVDGGEKPDGRAWEKRVLDRRTFGYTFEIGKYAIETRQIGHVALTLAFDPEGRVLEREVKKEIGDTIAEALGYFEEKFGPYPSDELTVVTSPRAFSQSMAGFITLSDLMMLDLGVWNLFVGLEDRRTVIAHELAHQWWGHQVGWESYRDAWLSEALANYSAVVYHRDLIEKDEEKKKRDDEIRFGPMTGWQAALTTELADGRAVESIGPVVLGTRLFSSHANDAYEPIVYRKGALIFDMLGRGFGRDGFPKILAQVAKVVDGRSISTEGFFDLVERISGVDLAAFERRFVRGTGLPEVYYSYRTTKTDEGKWQVQGEAKVRTPYHFRHRLVATPVGLDVQRERLDAIAEVDELWLIVPVQISFYDPARDEGKKKPKKGEAPEPNATLNGHLRLSGAKSPIDIPIDFEPRRFWLDKEERVFGRFFDESRNPKRMLYYQALDDVASGDIAGANATLDRALAAKLYEGREEDNPHDDPELAARRLDGRIHLARCRLLLDEGRENEAEAELETARKGLRGALSGWVAEESRVIEARIASRRGDFERVYKLLRKAVLKSGEVDSAEGAVLLAAAAKKTGHLDQYEKAVEVAKEANADLSALEVGK